MTLESYVKDILVNQSTTGHVKLKRKNLVRITKEWRDWIVKNNALVYYHPIKREISFHPFDFGYLRVFDFVVYEGNNRQCFTGTQKPDANLPQDSCYVFTYQDCFLTRELIKNYKKFIGIEKSKERKENASWEEENKKVDFWLTGDDSLYLP